MDTINQRISKIAFEFFDDNNSKFAVEIGTSEANIRNYRSKTEPKIAIINRIAEKLAISFEWLLTGKGPMLREASAGKPQTAPVAAPAAMPERAPAIAEVAFYKEILEKKDVEIRELNREIGALQHANAVFRQQVATLQEQGRELVAVQHENTALKQQVADLLQELEENKKNSATKHDAAQLAVPEHCAADL